MLLLENQLFGAILTHWPLGDFLEKIIFTLILVTGGCDISSEIALRWTSRDLNDDKSTLVQVMAWCHQATSHYLNQCWPRSLPPCDVTRPQWVKIYHYVGQSTWSMSLYFLSLNIYRYGFFLLCLTVAARYIVHMKNMHTVYVLCYD